MVPRLPHTDTQTLSAHDFKVTVEPGTGALIRAIEWQAPDGTTHQLLYSPGDVAATSKMPNRFGAWAMVPFANRAFGGILRDGALVYDLPINAPDGEATIHGFGWQSAWDVSHSSAARLILRHSRSEMSGPYHYTAQLSISLVPGTVAIALSVVNLGDIALPYGIGLHPWFPCAQDTRLALHADGEFLFAPGYRATGRSDFTDGGAIQRRPDIPDRTGGRPQFHRMGRHGHGVNTIIGTGTHDSGQRKPPLACCLGTR